MYSIVVHNSGGDQHCVYLQHIRQVVKYASANRSFGCWIDLGHCGISTGIEYTYERVLQLIWLAERENELE